MQTRAWEKLKKFASTPGGQTFLVILVLALSLIIRMLLFRVQGCNCDLGTFRYWYNTAADKGIYGFYDALAWCDYPPFNVYIFWLFGKIAHAIGPDSLDFFIRFPANLFDLATGYLIFRMLRPRYSFAFSLAAMAVYVFNPAVIYESAVWGQMDSVYTFFMVASLYSVLRSRYELSSGLFVVAILTKPQSVLLLPILAYIMIRKAGWKRILGSIGVSVALLFVLLIPFHWDNPITFLIDHYKGYSMYEYNSLNAYNFWAYLGFWKPDATEFLGLSYQWWGIIAFLVFFVFVMWQFHRKPGGRAPVFAVFLLMFGFYMFMTRMHERYLFSVLALLAMSFSPRYPPWLYVGLSGTFLTNLVFVMSQLNHGSFTPDDHWSIYVLSTLNAIMFLYAIWSFWKMQHSKKEEKPPEPKPPGALQRAISSLFQKSEAPEEEPSSPVPKVPIPRTHMLILVLLVVIFLGMSLWNLGDWKYPSSYWVPQKDPEEVYLDLGTATRVENVYLLVLDDRYVNVELYWGSPGNWTHQTNLTESSVWAKWDSLYLNRDTRYIRLVFTNTTARIGEIALFADGRRLNIAGITGDQDNTVAALIDEQNRVGNPASRISGTYWDEIYFTRTAEQTLKLQDPSQWDHPPTSKLIMAAGIAVFGHNPFAWRIPGVIVAALGIVLIYFFAKRMFKSSGAGLIAAFLLTFEFMHFVEARTAVPETYILFFVIAMFYFFYRYWEDPQRCGKYLFLSFVFFGLGFSTKWHVMYGFVGMMILLIVLKWRKPVIRWNEVFWFAGGCLAAVAIYMLSYTTYFLADHGWHDWWDLQQRMYDFHAHLSASYYGSSAWYTWPLMLRPMWMYVGGFDNSTAYISSFGNPALWWAGIPAMLAIFWLAIKHRNNIAIFISIPFLTQWLIFAPIGRVIMIYHFFPNVLFLVLAVTMWCHWLWNKYNWGKWVVAGYLVINVACFALFFPVISGLPMSNDYWNSMQWMRDWITTGFGPH